MTKEWAVIILNQKGGSMRKGKVLVLGKNAVIVSGGKILQAFVITPGVINQIVSFARANGLELSNVKGRVLGDGAWRGESIVRDQTVWGA
jgi:hypothetical protein